VRSRFELGFTPPVCAIGLLLLFAPQSFAINEFQSITAADAADNDNFGFSVGMSGNTAILGAYRDNDGGVNAGSAYIFRNPGSGVWSQLDKLVATDAAANDNFGTSVAIAGNTAVIGAPFDNTGRGAAYIFRDNGAGDWTQLDKLLAGDPAIGDTLGLSVAISGNTAIVGAPGKGGSAGAAYVFRDNGAGDWQQITKLTANDGVGGDEFGFSVALSGNTALVGARFDSTPALGAAGAVYVFQDNGGNNWPQVTKLLPSDPTTSKQFGTSVAFTSNTAVIGAIGDNTNGILSGAAYIFQRDASQVWQQKEKLTASDAATEDEFGYSVGIDGNTVVVGAWQDDDPEIGSGSAYLFRTDSLGSWNQVAKLRASDQEQGDAFGSASAISGGVSLVGASLANNGTDSGAGYLYNVPNVLAGDFNGNGRVDAADIVVWRNTLNQIGAGLPADGNGDGVVNQADRALWRRNFGLSAAAAVSGSTALVPEPSTAALLALAICLTTRVRSRFQPLSRD
jgi:hypothetical protein